MELYEIDPKLNCELMESIYTNNENKESKDLLDRFARINQTDHTRIM